MLINPTLEYKISFSLFCKEGLVLIRVSLQELPTFSAVEMTYISSGEQYVEITLFLLRVFLDELSNPPLPL